ALPRGDEKIELNARLATGDDRISATTMGIRAVPTRPASSCDRAFGAETVYPPQYLRARPEHWPGVALVRR
ncbi:MAG: hypothetical protein ACREE2_20905, partial [Stellaceae bacterium]